MIAFMPRGVSLRSFFTSGRRKPLPTINSIWKRSGVRESCYIPSVERRLDHRPDHDCWCSCRAVDRWTVRTAPLHMRTRPTGTCTGYPPSCVSPPEPDRTADRCYHGDGGPVRREQLTIQRMEPVGCTNWWDPLHLVFTVAKPKSPIFTVSSSDRNMLLDFMSRWIIFLACR